MSHIKGKPIHRYCLIAAMLVFGILLAYGPARADEEPPLEEGEIEEYQTADPSPDPAVAPVCNPDIPDMVGYWPLDDPSTLVNNKITFLNYMGNNNGTCTYPGCPQKITGKVNGAYEFVPYSGDPYTDWPDGISVPKYSDLDWENGDSFSLETWVNIPETATCSGNRVFVGRRGAGVFSIWLGCADGTNKARFSVRDNTGTVTFFVDSATVLNDGEWHHVVGVRDAVANKLHIYVDGALEGSVNAVYTQAFSGQRSLSIGWFDPDNPSYFLHGSLDEIAVYKRALTLANVQSHYNGGNGKSYCSAGPVVTDPGDQTDQEGDTVSLQIQAEDQEAGTLNYSAPGLPEGLTINSLSGLISGRLTCEASEGSPYNITVTVRNVSTNRSGSTNFSWTVTDKANCVTRRENYIPAVLKEQ